MDFIQHPPKFIDNLLPEAAKPWGWWAILGLAGLILLFLLWIIVGRMFTKKTKMPREQNLEEDLSEYPQAKPSTGDRQLRVEGVPVRLRLVVIAPAGKDAEDVDPDEAADLLERVLPGLGEIYKADKPRVRVWPVQLSYEGFTKHFHRNTLIPEPEGDLSRWVIVGGRAKLGKRQIMLGLAMQAVKPNTVGRKSIDAHEWPTVLRVRVKE